jgi:hypothetical protein
MWLFCLIAFYTLYKIVLIDYTNHREAYDYLILYRVVSPWPWPKVKSSAMKLGLGLDAFGLGFNLEKFGFPSYLF